MISLIRLGLDWLLTSLSSLDALAMIRNLLSSHEVAEGFISHLIGKDVDAAPMESL